MLAHSHLGELIQHECRFNHLLLISQISQTPVCGFFSLCNGHQCPSLILSLVMPGTLPCTLLDSLTLILYSPCTLPRLLKTLSYNSLRHVSNVALLSTVLSQHSCHITDNPSSRETRPDTTNTGCITVLPPWPSVGSNCPFTCTGVLLGLHRFFEAQQRRPCHLSEYVCRNDCYSCSKTQLEPDLFSIHCDCFLPHSVKIIRGHFCWKQCHYALRPLILIDCIHILYCFTDSCKNIIACVIFCTTLSSIGQELDRHHPHLCLALNFILSMFFFFFLSLWQSALKMIVAFM